MPRVSSGRETTSNIPLAFRARSRISIAEFTFPKKGFLPFQPPWCPPLPGQHAVGGIVIDKTLRLGVPANALVAAQTDGDVADVAHRHRAMTDADVADRLPAAAQAIDEVTHVVVGYFQPRGVLRQGLVNEAAVAGLNGAAADEQPFAVFARKEDPVIFANRLRDVRGAAVAAYQTGAVPAFRTICVSVGDLELG